MNETNWPDMYRSDDPRFHDPRYQRRIVSFFYPIPIIENMYDITLDCGHAPLMFRNAPPVVGDLSFCPECYKAAQP